MNQQIRDTFNMQTAKKIKLKLQKMYWLVIMFLLLLPVSVIFAQPYGGGSGGSGGSGGGSGGSGGSGGGSGGSGGGSSGSLLENPISGIDSISQFFDILLELVVKIASPIVVFMVIYSGFLFVKAQGNPEKLSEAKKAIMWTLIGAIIVLGAFVLSKVISGTVDDLQKGIILSNIIKLV